MKNLLKHFRKHKKNYRLYPAFTEADWWEVETFGIVVTKSMPKHAVWLAITK